MINKTRKMVSIRLKVDFYPDGTFYFDPQEVTEAIRKKLTPEECPHTERDHGVCMECGDEKQWPEFKD